MRLYASFQSLIYVNGVDDWPRTNGKCKESGDWTRATLDWMTLTDMEHL